MAHTTGQNRYVLISGALWVESSTVKSTKIEHFLKKRKQILNQTCRGEKASNQFHL
jgi:hypothetical protein